MSKFDEKIIFYKKNMDSMGLSYEDELFNRERQAFINLAKTQPTLDRISALIEKGVNLRN